MSVTTGYAPERYAGDGAQTVFEIPWPFIRADQVRVTRTTGGVDTLLTEGADYTVTPGAGVGGTFTMAEPPADGATLTVWREMPLEQPDVYPQTGVFDLKTAERGFDRLTMLVQQVAEGVGRAVKVAITSGTSPDRVMDDINAALQGAQQAAGQAGDNAVAAETARAGAEDAREGAEIARAGSEAARDEAGQRLEEVEQAVADAREEVVASAAFVPIGAILDFPVNTVPAGFLVCAGQTVTRAAYPELVAYLAGDSAALSATLPDLRGEFRRGADLGRGVDAGRTVGSAQGDAFQGHWHELWRYGGDVFGGGSSPGISSGANTNTKIGDGLVRTATADGTNGTPRVASETRPRNVAVVSCIKAYHAPMSAEPVDLTAMLDRLNALETSGAEAKQPQTIMRCRMKTLAPPFHDMPQPDFLAFSGLTVTLLADVANPFMACFGSGGTSVTGQTEENLSVTIASTTPRTYWLALGRNPDTGALAFTAEVVPPEYSTARGGMGVLRGVGTAIGDMTLQGGLAAAFDNVVGQTGAASAAKGANLGSYVGKDFGVAVSLRGVRVTGGTDTGFANTAANVTVSLIGSNTNDPASATQVLTSGVVADVPGMVINLFDANINASYRYWWVKVVPSASDSTYVADIEWLSVGDWYNPATNILLNNAGVQRQRIYVGKAVVSGGAVTAVVPFHPGVFAFIPGNGGNATAASTWMYEHNPFGAPVLVLPPELYSLNMLPWLRQMDYNNNAGSGDGVWMYAYDNGSIQWQCVGSNRLGKYRIPVRRAF